MPELLTDSRVRLLRQRANRLLEPDDGASTAEVVQSLVGIQAQDQPAAALAIRPRSARLTAVDVARARNEERAIVRTWAMRGTLHWLAAEDVRWLLALFCQDFIRKNRRGREELGLDDETSARGVRQLRDVLADRGPLTRDAITEALASRGVKLEGQARPHLLYAAAFQGVICYGPDRGAQPTYVLLDDWVAKTPEMSRETALAELARRYLVAFGPATPADFAAWSGLAMPDARRGWQQLRDEVIEADTSRGPMSMLMDQASWIHDEPAPDPTVHLLGAFDSYPLGYRDRELVVPAPHGKRINAGGGIIRPTLILDGQVVSTWKTRRRRDQLEVIVAPFENLAPNVVPAIEAEARDVGRFLGVEATLSAGEAASDLRKPPVQ